MRAVKTIGILLLIIWMAWITVRVEMALRAADDACREAFLTAEKAVPADRCASALFFVGFVDHFPNPNRISN